MLGHIIHCKTASEIWKTLEQLFSTKSKARILNFRLMLQSTKKGSMTIEDYFLKMKSLSHELMVAGQPVSEDELVLHVLGGLGPEYEYVVATLTSKDSVSITEAQFLLQTHESRLENFHSIQMTDVSSASANVLHKRDTTGFQNVRQYSYQSSSTTRLQNFGQHPSPSSSRGSWHSPRGRGRRGHHNGRSFSNSKPLCQICGKTGHSALKCYHRFDVSYHGVVMPNNLSSLVSSSQFPQTHIATASTIHDSAWYFDSGATYHSTPNSAALISKSAYTGPGMAHHFQFRTLVILLLMSQNLFI